MNLIKLSDVPLGTKISIPFNSGDVPNQSNISSWKEGIVIGQYRYGDICVASDHIKGYMMNKRPMNAWNTKSYKMIDSSLYNNYKYYSWHSHSLNVIDIEHFILYPNRVCSGCNFSAPHKSFDNCVIDSEKEFKCVYCNVMEIL